MSQIRFWLVAIIVLATLETPSAQAAAVGNNTDNPPLTIELRSDIQALDGKRLQFEGAVRLSQVFVALEQQENQLEQIDWSRMRLVSSRKHSQVLKQRQQAVENLYSLYGEISRENTSQADLIRRLAEQVAQWPLIGAEPIGAEQLGLITAGDIGQLPAPNARFAVSPTDARNKRYADVVLKAQLDDGTAQRWQLILPSINAERTGHPVVGAVYVPFRMPYKENQTAYRQLSEFNFNSRLDALAQQDEVVEVTARGQTRTIAIANYNQTGAKLGFGSILYVPLKPSMFDKRYQQLNTELQELLAYWSPLADYSVSGAVAVNPQQSQQLVIDDEIAQTSAVTRLWQSQFERQRPWRTTYSDFGTVGLLQTPTARMADTGELAFSYSDSEEYRRMTINLQLFPWLETTVRYNDIRTRLYSQFPGFSGDQTYKDRGFDVKLKALEESQWLPAVSVGLRDVAGTGLFASEYVVATKRLGDFEFSAGMGWGYLGKNDNATSPFCELKGSFCLRPGGTSGRGGSFEMDKWFKGSAAWFGGVEYQFDAIPLSVKLEYDPNNYRNEPAGRAIPQDSRFNFGLDYAITDNLHARISYERGNTWMFGATYRANLNEISMPKIDPEPELQQQATAMLDVEQIRYGQPQRQLVFSLQQELHQAAGFELAEAWLSEDSLELTLIGNSFRYRDHRIALQRLAQVVITHIPKQIQTLNVIERVNGMDMAETRFDLNQLKQTLARFEPELTIADTYTRRDISGYSDGQQLLASTHEISWPKVSIKPFLEQGFGGPEDFYLYMFGLDANFSFSLGKQTFIAGTLATSLDNNYDKFNFTRVPSNLPPVRTLVREYVSQSDVLLRDLSAVHQFQAGRDLFAQVYAGYFELMFAGVGTEWLYRPLDSDWSFGVDINYVRQRSFENRTSLLDYDVVTGHASLYYQPRKWLPNSMFNIHVGQFLAGDRGVQIAYEHKFDSGIIAGAFAAKTNVSADEFGEGSFNKGFYISVPFDLLQLRHAKGRGTISWIPITRDGGQMLIREFRMTGFTEDRSRYYTD